MALKIEKFAYAGWPNCLRLSNPMAELIITTDIGPRIIKFALTGKENVFKEYKDQLGRTGDDKWNIYGGHRLWHAPENDPRSYQPDNSPVEFKELNGFVKLTQAIEKYTGLKKEMDIYLSPDDARVKVVHRISNNNPFAVEFSVWCLSVMDTGGKAILPLPPRGEHPQLLMPSNNITLWHFTHMDDPRWHWGKKYVTLEQHTSAKNPQKAGAGLPDGWIAYANKGQLFIKKAPYFSGEVYADMGASIQTFTNQEMLELETLSPLGMMQPGMAIEHTETWALFDAVEMPADEEAIDKDVLTRAQQIKFF